MSIVDASNAVVTVSPGVPDVDAEAVAACVTAARAEVAGFSQTSGTRQAVEALCDAIEALIS